MLTTTFVRDFTLPYEVFDMSVVREICRFRARVWRQIGQLAENAFSPEGWYDPIDSDCRHWVIRDGRGTIVAAGRLSVHPSLDEVHQAGEYRRYGLDLPGPIAAPDRVVVCPSTQGCGLGRQILDVQDHAARMAGARHAVRQASPRMIQLLQHRGWQIHGPASPDERFPGVEFQVATKGFFTAARSQILMKQRVIGNCRTSVGRPDSSTAPPSINRSATA